MAKFIVSLSLLLAITIIGSSASKLPKNVKVEVVSTEKLKDILKLYPNAKELPRRVLSQEKEARDVVPAAPHVLMEYYLGARVAGDYVAAHDSQSHSWETQQDVEMTLSYPSSGTGRILSYINILVRQSNERGRAYVLSGGIGQRNIRIVVEAYQTYILDHDANFYGY